ncbi:MAG: hypothetical protein N2037_09795, partial [Acidimicrobiales bacterium]|nr:hypothetical protein [Acidimicrobiales bacterium]
MTNRDLLAAFRGPRWHSRWIWTDPAPVILRPDGSAVLDREKAPGWSLFRRIVEIDRVPNIVPARMTSDSRYRLWVNGTEASSGPVRSHPERLHYDVIDLA